MSNYNLILTGFMGVGKTTVGQLLAKRLNRRFIDTDQIIQERMDKTVPEIFAAYGEPFFRALEASVCTELGQPQNLVISTGGGALVNFDNLRAISGPGNIIFCLTANPETILERLVNDRRNRPLIDNQPEVERRAAISSLLTKRQAAYGRIRIQIDTTDKSAEAIADEILRHFERETERNKIRLPVLPPHDRYDIYCARGILNDLSDVLRWHNLNQRAFIVTNTTIAPLYGEKLAASLPNSTLITVPDGEIYKTLETVKDIYSAFAEAGLDRHGVVFALGGGVIGDMVGYAAATYMRGVKLVQIPTSLLAMVDSSVGGKVGVDIPEGKNLVGAFKQPEIVVIDPDVLATLPDVEIRCGLAEAVKHALIADPSLLDQIDAIAAGDAAALRANIKIKIGVVQRDPYEKGERAHLNFGHTFGHAIEQASGYTWRHGEAVAVGMVAAARLSEQLGTLRSDEVVFIIKLLTDLGLPTSLGDTHLSPESILAAMGRDKKARDGQARFVILEGIGKAGVRGDVPRELVLEILAGLGAKKVIEAV